MQKETEHPSHGSRLSLMLGETVFSHPQFRVCFSAPYSLEGRLLVNLRGNLSFERQHLSLELRPRYLR
jgi:hypothetical protein